MSDTVLITYEPLPPRVASAVEGRSPTIIELPHPELTSGSSLMAALSLRRSTREFYPRPLSPATLGELLWAANGVNRNLSGGRTAPSAYAFHEIDVYAVLPNGVYRYDALQHHLALKHPVDARNLTGYQDFVGAAPLDLVYVVRTSTMLDVPPQQQDLLAAVSAGAIAQNVALYCASVGLGSVVRGWINHRALADALSLNEDELPIFAQTVGWPAAGKKTTAG